MYERVQPDVRRDARGVPEPRTDPPVVRRVRGRRRTAADPVVRRLLDPEYEDEVFDEAAKRNRLEVAGAGTIAPADPRRALLTTHVQETGRAATPKTAPTTVGKIAANDPRQALLQVPTRIQGPPSKPRWWHC